MEVFSSFFIFFCHKLISQKKVEYKKKKYERLFILKRLLQDFLSKNFLSVSHYYHYSIFCSLQKGDLKSNFSLLAPFSPFSHSNPHSNPHPSTYSSIATPPNSHSVANTLKIDISTPLTKIELTSSSNTNPSNNSFLFSSSSLSNSNNKKSSSLSPTLGRKSDGNGENGLLNRSSQLDPLIHEASSNNSSQETIYYSPPSIQNYTKEEYFHFPLLLQHSSMNLKKINSNSELSGANIPLTSNKNFLLKLKSKFQERSLNVLKVFSNIYRKSLSSYDLHNKFSVPFFIYGVTTELIKRKPSTFQLENCFNFENQLLELKISQNYQDLSQFVYANESTCSLLLIFLQWLQIIDLIKLDSDFLSYYENVDNYHKSLSKNKLDLLTFIINVLRSFSILERGNIDLGSLINCFGPFFF